MNLKMKKVATAVAVGLGASAVGMNAAYSDELMFPYVASSPTVTTVLSVINNQENFPSGFVFPTEQLHYRYFYKSGDAALSKTSSCQEIDFRRVTSPNDLVTWSADAHFGTDSLAVLFEDPADQVNANYTARNQNFGALRNVTKPIRSFLVVDNNDFFGAGVGISVDPRVQNVAGQFGIINDFDETIYGEAILFEFATGAAWGYKAYNPSGIYADGVLVNGAARTARINPYDFTDRVEKAGEVTASPLGPFAAVNPTSLLPFPPAGEVSTRFFVTPVSNFQLRGDLAVNVRFAVNNPASATFDVAFDRDENPVSGQVPMDVVCVAGIDATTMFSQGALGEIPQGGWTNVVVRAPSGTSSGRTSQAVIMKLEFNDLTNTFADGSVAGTYNNGIYLTKGIRESLVRPSSIYAVTAIAGGGPTRGDLLDYSSPCAEGLPISAFAPGTIPACLNEAPSAP